MYLADPTAEQIKSWEEWKNERGPEIKAVCDRFPPWGLYRMKATGHRVKLCSIMEHRDRETNAVTFITFTVHLSGDFNLLLYERVIAGVPSDALEPCNPPSDAERVGILAEPVAELRPESYIN